MLPGDASDLCSYVVKTKRREFPVSSDGDLSQLHYYNAADLDISKMGYIAGPAGCICLDTTYP